MLIGITGPAGHGKDTVAKFLLNNLGDLVVPYAYADPIKHIVHDCFRAPLGPEDREQKEMVQDFDYNLYRLYTHFMLNKPLQRQLFQKVCPAEQLLDTIKEHVDVIDEHTMRTSWRELYQLTGTEWGRQKVDLDLWINMAPKDHAIITDVRGQGDHPVNKNTEALHVINNGGIMLEVVDPRKGKALCRDHSSEARIDPHYIHHTFINEGTLMDLEDDVVDFTFTHLMKGA